VDVAQGAVDEIMIAIWITIRIREFFKDSPFTAAIPVDSQE